TNAQPNVRRVITVSPGVKRGEDVPSCLAEIASRAIEPPRLAHAGQAEEPARRIQVIRYRGVGVNRVPAVPESRSCTGTTAGPTREDGSVLLRDARAPGVPWKSGLEAPRLSSSPDGANCHAPQRRHPTP